MLVCNVSLRAAQSGITADLTEIAVAQDASTIGNIVFATLVDDPASVGEIVDAYLGEIMVEAASAIDATDASLPAVYAAGVAEAATAADSTDGALAVLLATFDGAATQVTMSNGNLTATHNNIGNGGVRSVAVKSAGKYYFEVTVGATHGTTDFMGVILSTAAVGDPATGVNVTGVYPNLSGNVYSNGSFSGKGVTTLTAGDIAGVAIDLNNRKAWFRRNAGGWFQAAIGSENPATNTGGVTIASGSWTPAVGFLGSGAAVNDAFTANFGQSAYANAAPSGYGNWPAT